VRGDTHAGCGERVGETDWPQDQHRAPARLNRDSDSPRGGSSRRPTGRRGRRTSPMDVLVERCAALDVHQNTVVACVRLPRPDGGRLQELRAFKATTAGLLGLADWLDSYQVTLVGMEPDRRLLDAGLAGPGGPGLRLAAGRPGTCATCPAARPTWAMRSGCASWSDLVRAGPADPGAARLTRDRKAQIQERTREVQRLDTVVQDAGTRAVQRGVQGPWRVGPADAGGHDRRHPRPECSPSWPRAAYGPSCRRSGRRCRPVPDRASRAAGGTDPGPHRPPRRAVGLLSARIEQLIARSPSRWRANRCLLVRCAAVCMARSQCGCL
jgi:hypothetical protein